MHHHLPVRPGPKPSTTPRTPHRQLDQISPPTLQAALWQRMASLADVSVRPSGISVPGSRALWLEHPGNARGFMVGREFAHLHPSDDGSLHMILDPRSHELAIAGGWAEPHPLAGRHTAPTNAMVFGPRDELELEAVWWLVQQSWRFASGLAPELPSLALMPQDAH